jgi:FtsP/CotA-like multicopper oxidase with cupredoxin domain
MHPMHLHGHSFWVVAEGVGEWDGVITRPENPQRRDTHIIDWGYPSPGKPSYVVIDFLADNPGVWPFHCHVAWHISDGLSMNVMVSYNHYSLLNNSLFCRFVLMDGANLADKENLGTP